LEQNDGEFSLRDKYGTRKIFDHAGLMTDVYDRFENHTQFAYASGDWLQAVTDPYGVITSFGYGARLTSVTDLGRTTRFGWAGNSVVVTEPYAGQGQSGHATWSFALGPDGLLRRLGDPQFHTTVINYQHYRVHDVVNAANSAVENTWQLIATNVQALPVGGFGVMQLASDVKAHYADGNGNIWTYTTDAYGYLTSRTNPAPFGDTWTWTRNENGLATEYVQPAGGGGIDALPALTTTYQYDGKGNLVSASYADGSSETWQYDSHFSQVVGYALSRDGSTRSVGYDLNSRGAAVAMIEGPRETRYLYSPAAFQQGDLPGGLTTAMTEAYGTASEVTTLFEYWDSGPSLGLARRTVGAFGTLDAAAVKFSYDARRNPNAVRDELNQTTGLVFDNRDRLVTVAESHPGTADHNRPVTQMFWDTVGNQRRVVDARGNPVRSEYDAMNRLRQVIEPPGDAGTIDWVRSYDANGNLTSLTDPLGNVTTYAYDERNLLVRVTQPDPGTGQHAAPVTTYSYDSLGNPATSEDARGNVTRYQYDALQRNTRTTLPDPDGPGRLASPVTTTEYLDANGSTRVTDPNGGATERRFNLLGQLASVTDAAGGVTSYVNDLRGNRVSETDPLGRRTSFAYDSQNRLTSVVNALGGVRAYTYDDAGNMLASVDELGRQTTYTYDHLNRNVRVLDPLGGTTTSTYDAVGNLVAETDKAGYTTRLRLRRRGERDAGDRRSRLSDVARLRCTEPPNANDRRLGRRHDLWIRRRRQPDARDGRARERDRLRLRPAGPADGRDRRPGRRHVDRLRRRGQPPLRDRPPREHDRVDLRCAEPGPHPDRPALAHDDLGLRRGWQPALRDRRARPRDRLRLRCDEPAHQGDRRQRRRDAIQFRSGRPHDPAGRPARERDRVRLQRPGTSPPGARDARWCDLHAVEHL